MKKKLRGVKRQDIQLDFDLYRVRVPIPEVENAFLSVLDLHPEGTERTILFLHGYAGVLESWEFQINHFARSYRVVAPDLRGHGQSDAPYSQYTMPELVSDLHTIVESLDFPERFILVAHSFGGSIATEYAYAHPERLEKLILIATAGEFPLPKVASLLYRLPITFFRPWWKYRRRWDAEIHVVRSMMANNMRIWKGWDKMKALTTPTLVVTGEQDNYFPRWVFDDVGQTIPGAEIYDVGSAKHKVQLERHRAVNRALERFVDEATPRSWRGQAATEDPLANRNWIKNYSRETPPTIPIPRRTLPEFLASTAGWLPKSTVTIFYGTKLTYQQLDEQVNQFSHVLRGLGVRKGDRVMLVLPNMPQLLVAFYATLRLGAVAVLPNPDADAPSILEEIQQTSPKILVTLRGFAQLAEQIKVQTSVESVIVTDIRPVVSNRTYKMLMTRWGMGVHDEADGPLDVGVEMLEAMKDAPITPIVSDVSSQDMAAILFTSGTTDQPKGVCLSHYNLVANTLQTRHWIPDMQYGREVSLSVIPLIHSYGLINAMSLPIAIGATIVLLPVFDIEQVLEHVKTYKPSLFPGVPSMYTIINQTPNVREYGLSSIKACLSGAAPLPIEVQEAFEKLTRGRLVEGYGLTEASPVTHANPLSGVRKPGSIGIPLPNTDAKVVDLITGEAVSPGQIGELLVQGPQVMMGYWRDGAAYRPEDTFQGEWLRTGDVAVVDSDGYFQIVARKRDTIMFGDYSVYPRDVEEVLYENNKVMEVAVVGVGTEGEDQKVKAFVVRRPGSELTQEELLALCRKRLEPYAVPWEIEFRESLPKSFVGKVLRRMLVAETQV